MCTSVHWDCHQQSMNYDNYYLPGNIRVFCRIRPLIDSGARTSIDYIGNDGSLMVLDPLKPQSARKVFQFNKVFCPTATQGLLLQAFSDCRILSFFMSNEILNSHLYADDIYKDTESLIRSVMDGYNVCILAYGQTGSGKTHTMVSLIMEILSGSSAYCVVGFHLYTNLYHYFYFCFA